MAAVTEGFFFLLPLKSEEVNFSLGNENLTAESIVMRVRLIAIQEKINTFLNYI